MELIHYDRFMSQGDGESREKGMLKPKRAILADELLSS